MSFRIAILFLGLPGLITCVTGSPVPSPLEATEVRASAEQESPVTLEALASFAAIGDILMHGDVKRSAAGANLLDAEGKSTNHEGFPVLFEAIAPILSSADYTFANLETPVAPDANLGSRSMVFNVSAALLPALEESGIDLVSFGNNHVYDQGVKGLVETVERLGDSSLDYVGAGTNCAEARKPLIKDLKGIKVGFIASTMHFNASLNRGEDKPCAFHFEMEAAKASVAAARAAGAEIVVFSIHWGAEYRSEPSAGQQKIAHELLEAGVDLILGHHAHVLLPIEIRETKDGRMGVIAYGLGNNISNQSRKYVFGVHSHEHGNTRDGIILLVDFARKNYGKDPSGNVILRTELANVRAVPTWTTNNYRQRKWGETPHIRISPTHALLNAARDALASETGAKRSLALKKEIELYETRLSQVESILGEGILTRALPQPPPDPEPAPR
jgi:poly-gamma-glutamate synthesis protein (capsule biosynthesis protein)